MLRVTEAQIRLIAEATNATHDGATQQGLIAAIDSVLPTAASPTLAGLVVKAATVAAASAAIPAVAPAGGVGTAAGGWDTAANRDLAITTINGLRTAVAELQTQLNAVLASMRAAGQLV